MEVSSIITELERQGQGIDRALAALRDLAGGPTAPAKARGVKRAPRKRRISAEGRAGMAEAARKRWAAKKAAGAAAAAPAQKAAKTASPRKAAPAQKARRKSAPKPAKKAMAKGKPAAPEATE